MRYIVSLFIVALCSLPASASRILVTPPVDKCNATYIGITCNNLEALTKGDVQCEVCAVRQCNKCYPHSSPWSVIAKHKFTTCVKVSQQNCSAL